MGEPVHGKRGIYGSDLARHAREERPTEITVAGVRYRRVNLPPERTEERWAFRIRAGRLIVVPNEEYARPIEVRIHHNRATEKILVPGDSPKEPTDGQ